MTESISSDIKQEANAALLEVDKGLKSSQPGDQCEAIVRFPSLMDQYPFPVLINVAFLKLADVFRTGSNLLRLNILRVVSVTQKHLNKITSSNEFFRRIYSVIHSNDPVARALTLKFFASISKIISERKSVHHCIWKGLESHDQVEVEAAIIATDALCCYSSTFAAGVYEKITGIILGLKTPPEMKIKVIPVLKRINHTLAIASQVKDVCLQLLESHPSLSFVSVILPTLTDLAISTLVLANEQISLLMDYAQNDPRKSIRQNALRGLYSLSVKAPQCWDGDIIKKLVQLVIETSYHNEKVIGCKIIYKLSLSLAIVHHMSHITDDLKSLCLLKSTVASAYAISARCNINMAASDQYSYNNMNTMEEIIELLVVHLTTNEQSQANSEVIKVLLSSLSKASINCTIKEELLELLISQLPILPDDCHSALCNTVTVIVSGCNERQASLYPSVTQHLIQLFKSNPTLVPLSIMLLEIHKGSYTSPQYESFMTNVQPLLHVHLTNQQSHDRYWQAYKIARESTKLGFHSFAGSIYNNLYHLMTDIKYRQWLQILHLFSEAQCIIASSLHNVNDLVISLQSASSILYKCSLLVKGTGQSSAIHCQFLPCLASLCDCYSQLLSLCISHKVLLPPDNLSNKFKCIINQLHSIGKRFSNLLRSLFDSDPSTLNYIKL
jgi:integrator complex subunit 7